MVKGGLMDPEIPCTCCGSEAKYNIHLSIGEHMPGPLAAIPRYYVPNQFARDEPEVANIQEV
jgi:hypothetical protein